MVPNADVNLLHGCARVMGGQSDAGSSGAVLLLQCIAASIIPPEPLVDLHAKSGALFSGEDVGHYGGSYKVTYDLYKKFGEQRLLDTPICGVWPHRPVIA